MPKCALLMILVALELTLRAGGLDGATAGIAMLWGLDALVLVDTPRLLVFPATDWVALAWALGWIEGHHEQ